MKEAISVPEEKEYKIGVSVICLTYNHEKYIRQCLDGFLMQETTFPFEVLINDDASTDNTATIIREYEQRSPEIIRPFYQAQNLFSQKISPFSSFLVPAARGKYIAFCEGDDYWTDPHKLQLQYEAMEAHPECSVSSHLVRVITETDEATQKTYPRELLQEGVYDSAWMVEMCAMNFQLQTNSIMVRASNEKEYQSNKPKFFLVAGVGDVPRVLYCATKGSLYYINKEMSRYRYCSAGSWTERIWKGSAETRIAHGNNMIAMMREFDTYTNGSYKQYCDASINKWNFSKARASKDYKTMVQKEYRQFFCGLHKKEKLLTYCGAYAPAILKAYRAIFRRKNA